VINVSQLNINKMGKEIYLLILKKYYASLLIKKITAVNLDKIECALIITIIVP